MALLSTPMDEMVALVATATHVGHVAADAVRDEKEGRIQRRKSAFVVDCASSRGFEHG